MQSVNFNDEETVYRINYWEIPSRIRSADYTFRYCLGGTAIIYIFDGNSNTMQSPNASPSKTSKNGWRATRRHKFQSRYS